MLALLVRYLLEEDTHKQVQHGLLTRVHTAPPSFFLLLSSFSPREMMGRGEAGVHRVSIECSVQRSVLALLVRYLLEQEDNTQAGPTRPTYAGAHRALSSPFSPRWDGGERRVYTAHVRSVLT